MSLTDSHSTKCSNKTQLRPEIVTVLKPHDIRNHSVATKAAKCAVIALATKDGNCAGHQFRSVDIAATCSCTVSRSERGILARHGRSNGYSCARKCFEVCCGWGSDCADISTNWVKENLYDNLTKTEVAERSHYLQATRPAFLRILTALARFHHHHHTTASRGHFLRRWSGRNM
jgi:hypothetical protein